MFKLIKEIIFGAFTILFVFLLILGYQIFFVKDSVSTGAANAFCTCSKVGSTVGVIASDLDDEATSLCLELSGKWRKFENEIETYERNMDDKRDIISGYNFIVKIGRFSYAAYKKCPDKFKKD